MNKLTTTVVLSALAAALVLAAGACTAPGAQPLGQAQHWERTCSRCHNLRDPGSLSDQQWDVAVHHMRVRGNLTAEEQQSIASFLKAGN